MDLHIGMKRAALLVLGHELVAKASAAPDGGPVAQTVRYVQANGVGDELVLTFDNDDMERPEVADDETYYELNA